MAISGSSGGPDRTVVDEGWGLRAVDFATLSEPGNCREYVAVQHRLGAGAPDRLLDVACGGGLRSSSRRPLRRRPRRSGTASRCARR